ncbi:MAG: hypothetical protein HN403_12925 [Rhodospirillales bacterium]|nr:hypothetical protein [Rhodospirillales bacterium]
MHRISNEITATDELDRLSKMASYYDRLGCVEVARSLRQMVAARKTNGQKKPNDA